MAPILLIVVAVAAWIAFLRAESLRPRRRGAVIMAITAALLAVGGVVLMGIPGAVLYELSAPWVRLAMGATYRDLGDGAWPAAIVITLAWPASLVLAYTLANGPLRGRGRPLRWTVLVVVPYAAAVALTFWAHLSAGTA